MFMKRSLSPLYTKDDLLQRIEKGIKLKGIYSWLFQKLRKFSDYFKVWKLCDLNILFEFVW